MGLTEFKNSDLRRLKALELREAEHLVVGYRLGSSEQGKTNIKIRR